jgi:hypothetical protein
MSFAAFQRGQTAEGQAREREQAQQALLMDEHELHESYLAVLRSFGADIPSRRDLFQLWAADHEEKRR